MFEKVRRDMERACRANQGGENGVAAVLRELFNPGTQAILVYRFGFWADNLGFPLFRYPLRIVHFILQYIFSSRVGIFLHVKADVGAGLVIHTWGGGVFLPCCPIGRDVTIVGGGVLMDFHTRSIGDEVVIGAGTKVVGKVRIGNRVKTAPNSLIQRDIPDDCVVLPTASRVIGPIRAFRRGPTPGAEADTLQPATAAEA